jgi:hypothetical protein
MLTVGRDAVDLHDQPAVDSWFYENRPEPVAPCNAGRRYPPDNNYLGTSCTTSSRSRGLRSRRDIVFASAKLIFLSLLCVYPRHAP